MTDKELITFAANAISLVMPAWGFCNEHGVTIGSERDGPIYWNPLKNDVDAFKLAVSLQLEIYHADDEAMAVYVGYNKPTDAATRFCIEYYDDLPHMGCNLSATRRAIVRAAAEVGKGIKHELFDGAKNEYNF